ncbi:LPO_1073/Vpar_1526 family protein [Massilia phyllosphaerae]|uniref:LPO_1073/Vpar_1526 family protein n=1 Tax=Massilia phyllosphaerae TaxID=3106034 RepID=UPI002B1CAF52|nr:LPO_1073/Vpar_1526 family protein [Massilia sp. SGZ-792]
MLGKTQAQEAADGAVAVQAGRDVVMHVGVTTPEEVRALASDTFKADFVKMLGMAEAIAEARANKVLEAFIDRVERVNPSALRYANDPDFRYTLYTAQKTAARTDNSGLHDLLVELLVQRTFEAPRSLIQLVLNESIEVVQRISTSQINTLSLAFVILTLRFASVASFDTFLKTMDVYVEPLLSDVAGSKASLSHLEYAGCGTNSDTMRRLMADMLLRSYPGAFQQGASEAEAGIKVLSPAARRLLVPCEHNPARVQVLSGTREMLDDLCKQLQLDERDTKMLQAIFQGQRIDVRNVRSVCITKRPYLARLFDVWDKSALTSFSPTSVGIAIAHANLSKYGDIGPLSNWIN